MKFLVFTILTATALPGQVLAHPGHIADTGQGHGHWLIYLVLGCALFAIAGWAKGARSERAATRKRSGS